MPNSNQSTNRKSSRNSRLARQLAFDQLEDRRLLAGDLHGSMTERVYLKAIVSSRPTTAQVQSQPAVVGVATQQNSLPTAVRPTTGSVASRSQSKAAAPVVTTDGGNTTMNGNFAKAPTTAAVPSKQSLFGLKTPKLEKPTQEQGQVLGEVFVSEFQNTDVSTSGDWGAAAYQGKTRALEAKGSATLQGDPSKGKLSAKAEGSASLVKTEHKGQFALPTATIAGKEIATSKFNAGAEASVGVSGSAEASVNWNSKDAGGKLEAKAFAGVEVKGDVGVESRAMGIKTDAKADGYARAGAEGSAEASLKASEGLTLSAKGFAGAKAGGTAKSSIAGIGVGVDGEAWAGAGAEAELSGKMVDGKFKFKTSLGASPIVGGKAGFSVEVDPAEVAKFADLSDEVDELVEAIKKNEEAQAMAAKAQADALAARDEILAQINNFNAFANRAGSQVSNLGNNVVAQASNFGSSFVSLFG